MRRYFIYLLSYLLYTSGWGLEINSQAAEYKKDWYLSHRMQGQDIYIETESGKTWVVHSLPHMPSNQKPKALIEEWRSNDSLDFIDVEEAKLSPLCNRRTGEIIFAYYIRAPKQPQRYEKNIYIAGERCSGTHFLEGIIENNIPKQAVSIHGGDHGPGTYERHFPSLLYMPKKMCLCTSTREAAKLFDKSAMPSQRLRGAMVVIIRDPYDWIRSFHTKKWYATPALKGLSFSDFIRSQWISINREKDPFTGRYFETPFELRSAKMLCMLEAAKSHRYCVICTYEKLLKEPEKLISYLANEMSIPVFPVFEPIRTVKNFKQQVFVPTKYPQFSQEDLDFINSRLDPYLEGLFGYKLIEEACHVPSNASL